MLEGWGLLNAVGPCYVGLPLWASNHPEPGCHEELPSPVFKGAGNFLGT